MPRYIDPFLPDADFAPRPDSVECALVDNHRDFIRQEQPQAVRNERPQLSPGIYLQCQANGGYALFVPCGSQGYRRIDGAYDELIQLASSLSTQ